MFHKASGNSSAGIVPADWRVWLLGLLLCTGLSRAATVRILSQDEDGLRFRVELDDLSVRRDTVEGREQLQLASRDALFLVESNGSARLIQPIELGIPADARVYLRELTRDLEHPDLAPPPLPEKDMLSEPMPVSVSLVPGAQLANEGWMRQQRIQRLVLTLATWDEGWSLMRSGEYELAFRRSPSSGESLQPARAESPDFDQLLDARLLNAAQARAWQRARVADSPMRTVHPAFAGNQIYKLSTSTDGLYKVTTEYLAAQGVPVAQIQSSRLALWRGESQVPILMSDGNDGRMDAGDYFIFHGEEREGENFPKSFFGPASHYFLSWDQGSSQRYLLDATVPGEQEPRESFVQDRLFEENRVWAHLERITSAPEETDHWFWRELSRIGTPGTLTQTLNIPWPVADSSRTDRIRFTCRGKSDIQASSPDHHLIFRVNDVFAGDLEYRLQEEGQSAWWPLPGTLLQPGNNTVQVELPLDHGNQSDLNYLNRIELSYLREIRLDDGHLTVPITDASFGDGAFVRVLRVKGVTGNLLAFSETAFITGCRPDPELAGAWLVPVPVGTGVIHLVAENSLKSPDEFKITENLNLHSSDNQADMLIVAPSQFHQDLQSLVTYHSQFRTVKLVDVDAIFNEFNAGDLSTPAIHDFLGHVFDHWQAPLPSYMLLVGKASNANLMDVGGGQIYQTLVPTDWVWTNSESGPTATDEEFSYIVGGPDDRFQDIMIGRFSVANRSQLQAYLEKHRQYREHVVKGPWMETSLFCADNGDLDFEAGDNYVTQNLVPPAQRFKQIHVRSNSIYHGGAVEFIDQFNSGSLVNSYNGHGNVGIYAGEALFRATDIRFLTNQGKYPICFAWSCLVGYYDDPDSMSMAELLLKQPNAGAIAFYGAAAKAYIKVNDPFVLNYFTRFYDERARTFGQGILLAEMSMYAISQGRNHISMFNLLGDPALEPAFPKYRLLPGADWLNVASGDAISVELSSDPPGLSGTVRAELWLEGRRGVNVSSAAAVTQVAFNGAATVNMTVPSLPETESHRGVIRFAMDTGDNRAIGSIPVFINSSSPGVGSHSPEQGIGGQPMTIELETLPEFTNARLQANLLLPGGTPLSNQRSVAPMESLGGGRWRLVIPSLPSTPNSLYSMEYQFDYKLGLVNYSFLVDNNEVVQEIPGGMFAIGSQEQIQPFADSLRITGDASATRLTHRFSVNSMGEPLSARLVLHDQLRDTELLSDSVAVLNGANVWDRVLNIPAGPTSLRLSTGPVWDAAGVMQSLNSVSQQDGFILLTPGQGSGGEIALDPTRYSLLAGTGALSQVVQIDSSFVSGALPELERSALAPGLAPLVEDPQSPGVLSLVPRLQVGGELADINGVRVRCQLDSTNLFRLADGSQLTAQESPRLALGRWNAQRQLWVMQAGTRTENPGGPLLDSQLHAEGGLLLPFRLDDDQGPSIQVDVNGQWFAPGDRVPRSPVFQIVISDPAGVDVGDGALPPRLFLDGSEVDFADLQLSDNRTTVLISWTPGELEAGSTHTLRIDAADVLGNSTTEELEFQVAIKLAVRFFANHPNPFASHTTFAWELTGAPRTLSFTIYTSAGRRVKTINVPLPRIGYDEFNWDGTDDRGHELANGLYYLQLKATDPGGTVEEVYKLARLQ